MINVPLIFESIVTVILRVHNIGYTQNQKIDRSSIGIISKHVYLFTNASPEIEKYTVVLAGRPVDFPHWVHKEVTYGELRMAWFIR